MASSSVSNSNSHQMQTSSNNSTSGSREYCLRWNNHQPNLVTYFGNLYTTESFVDVTLVSAEGKKVAAHKLVLSACSPYFQHIFENNPCKHPIVILKDVQFVDLQAIVKFIYNGEVNISQDRINTILKTANSLQVKGLAEVPADELKRVSSVVGEPTISSTRSHHTPPLTASASWSMGDSDSANEIPRKKLKKSASATSSYISGVVHSNGDLSSSVDSGVGASVSRSLDETSNITSEEMSTVQKRTSLPAPPPLLPKSRSLDHHLQRDSHCDSEMSSGLPDRQSYDDSSVGLDRGYEIEVADLKIEAGSDDCEIEFLEEEEEDYDESYAAYPSLDYDDDGSMDPNENETKQQYHNQSLQQQPQSTSASSSANKSRQLLRVSSAAGERRRRGRPLLRQPRIKRSDNEPSPSGGGRDIFGPELCTREQLGGIEFNESNGQTSSSAAAAAATSRESTNSSTDEDSQHQQQQHASIHQSNLPIVRVSQCSPTPPSSPPPHSPTPLIKEEQHAVIVSTITSASSSTLPITSSMIITPSSQATLLKVPSSDSQSHHHCPHSSSGSGSHLVKQISQPLLPSHSVIPLGGITTGNPVIRRQNSTPAPGQQQTRIVQSLKQGSVFQILSPSSEQHPGEDGDGKTFIIDLVPSGSVIRDFDSSRNEFKREGSSEQRVLSSSFSREDSITDDTGSSSVSLDDGLPVNRSGHCPALRPGPALGCNFCWNSTDSCGRILRRKTKYHCPECHINLCIVPCFQEYHEKTDKKKRPRSKLGLPKPSSM